MLRDKHPLISIIRASTICYVHDDYGIAAKKFFIQSQQNKFFQIDIKEAGSYYIMVNQNDARIYEKRLNYQYSYVSVVIAKETNPGHYQYKESFFGGNRDTWGQIYLEPGRYVVNVFVNWQSFMTQLTLSVYGPGSIGAGANKMNIVERINNVLENEFFEQVMGDMMVKKCNGVKTYDNFPGVSYAVEALDGFLVFQLTNFSERLDVQFEIIFLKKKNLIACKDQNRKILFFYDYLSVLFVCCVFLRRFDTLNLLSSSFESEFNFLVNCRDLEFHKVDVQRNHQSLIIYRMISLPNSYRYTLKFKCLKKRAR